LTGRGPQIVTAGRGAGDRLTKFIETNSIKPFNSKELAEVIKNPILFRMPGGGSVAYGYEATILADLCDAVLEARKHKIHYQQEHIAERCQALVRAFAKVGVVALVDETTGYQEIRARDASKHFLTASFERS
jgi:hypothetical protein